MNFKSWIQIVILGLFIAGCSSSRVVVERHLSPQIALAQEMKSIEVQSIAGIGSESFKSILIQNLLENTKLAVIHSQSASELIDAKLRGGQNRQMYKQADLIIRGSIQENIERRTGQSGETQYFVTSRPFIQLISASSGEILLSQQFIGTSISHLRPSGSIIDDGLSDAINSARRVALDKFISMFSPRIAWMEIKLYEFADKKKFKELQNHIEFGQLDMAHSLAKKYSDTTMSNDEERGKAMFSLAVIESFSGRYEDARRILLEAHRLFPQEDMMMFLKEIKKMENEGKKISMWNGN